MSEADSGTNSKSVMYRIKESGKFVGKYMLKFIKIAFEELIIFAKDFWAACKFVYKTRNKSRCLEAAKRNWWKFVKYFGAILVFSGLNLSLGTIGFVLGLLIVYKVLGVILPWLDERMKKNEVCKISRGKIYGCLAVGRILLPMIAILSLVSRWWLLLPGLIMIFYCGFVASNKRKEQAKEEYVSEQNILSDEKSNQKRKENENVENEKNKGKEGNKKEENTPLKTDCPSNNPRNNIFDNPVVLSVFDKLCLSSFKKGFENFFTPPSIWTKDEENEKIL